MESKIKTLNSPLDSLGNTFSRSHTVGELPVEFTHQSTTLERNKNEKRQQQNSENHIHKVINKSENEDRTCLATGHIKLSTKLPTCSSPLTRHRKYRINRKIYSIWTQSKLKALPESKSKRFDLDHGAKTCH